MTIYQMFKIVVLSSVISVVLAALTGCGGGGSPVGQGPGLGPGDNNALLVGQYTFSLTGQTVPEGAVVAIAGSFTADGNGHLGGVQDVNSKLGVNTGKFGGTYSLGTDGRGNAVLGIQAGCANWQFTMVSHTHGLLTCLNTSMTASGTIDLQDPSSLSVAALKGNYVFSFSGLGLPANAQSGAGLAVMAGDWTMDGNGNITRGEMDVNDLSGIQQDIPVSGTYSVGANGRGIATLNSSFTTQKFAFYIANRGDLKFVETDAQPVVSGEVLAQASGPFTPLTLKGQLAFTLSGVDSNNVPITVGGIFSSDGNGGISNGVLDSNDGGTVLLGSTLTGNYALSTTGRGLANLTSSPALQLAFYPAANGTIELVDIGSGLGVVGMARGQIGLPFSVASTSGNYAPSFTGTNLISSGAEEDITGQLIADGAGNLNGVLDVNNFGSIFQKNPISGSSYTMATNGRGTAVLNTASGTFDMQTYQIDPGTILFLESDQGRVIVGIAEKQQF